jgi:hypothetical protein
MHTRSRYEGAIITDPDTIREISDAFRPNVAAYPTNRPLPGSDSALDPQEWAERGTYQGMPCVVYYLFSGAEGDAEDAADMPWDSVHIDRIVFY